MGFGAWRRLESGSRLAAGPEGLEAAGSCCAVFMPGSPTGHAPAKGKLALAFLHVLPANMVVARAGVGSSAAWQCSVGRGRWWPLSGAAALVWGRGARPLSLGSCDCCVGAGR